MSLPWRADLIGGLSLNARVSFHSGLARLIFSAERPGDVRHAFCEVREKSQVFSLGPSLCE